MVITAITTLLQMVISRTYKAIVMIVDLLLLSLFIWLSQKGLMRFEFDLLYLSLCLLYVYLLPKRGFLLKEKGLGARLLTIIVVAVLYLMINLTYHQYSEYATQLESFDYRAANWLTLVGVFLFWTILYGLIIIVLYSTAKTYFTTEEEEVDLGAKLQSIPINALSTESKNILDTFCQMDDMIEANINDKAEVNSLVIPHPVIDQNGKADLEAYRNTLIQLPVLKIPQRKSIQKYTKQKIDWKSKEYTLKELVTIIADTPAYENMADNVMSAAHELNIDDAYTKIQDMAENIKGMSVDGLHEALGETLGDHLQSTVEAGTDSIPIVSSVFEVFKQGKKYKNGDIKVKDALKQSGTKLGLKTLCAGIGSLLGAPLGPAGMWLGGFAGSWVGNSISHDIKTAKLKECVKELEQMKTDFNTSLEQSSKELDNAYLDAGKAVSHAAEKKQRQFDNARAVSPIDNLDKTLCVIPICIMARDYALQYLSVNNRKARTIIKYVPSINQINQYPEESMAMLLYTLKLTNELYGSGDYYNEKLIVNECNRKIQFEMMKLQMEQDEWIIDVYMKYNIAISDIVTVLKKETDKYNRTVGVVMEKLQKEKEELNLKQEEADKERRKAK